MSRRRQPAAQQAQAEDVDASVHAGHDHHRRPDWLFGPQKAPDDFHQQHHRQTDQQPAGQARRSDLGANRTADRVDAHGIDGRVGEVVQRGADERSGRCPCPDAEAQSTLGQVDREDRTQDAPVSRVALIKALQAVVIVHASRQPDFFASPTR